MLFSSFIYIKGGYILWTSHGRWKVGGEVDANETTIVDESSRLAKKKEQ